MTSGCGKIESSGHWMQKEKISEAGNRTPVVRVTGGNTKPLYYFGSVLLRNLGHLRQPFHLSVLLFTTMVKRQRSDKKDPKSRDKRRNVKLLLVGWVSGRHRELEEIVKPDVHGT